MRGLSIVIPVFNEQENIATCLESIEALENQVFGDVEVLVVDDGSTDATLEVVKKFKGVRIIELGKNRGRYIARKLGFERAKYDVLYIDARSIAHPKLLSSLASSHMAYPIQGASYGLDALGRASELTIFERFYTLVRKKLFRKFDLDHAHFIEPEHFDSHPKGTGIFYCPRLILREAYENLGDLPLESDDTALLCEISHLKKIYYDPSVSIVNYGRKTFQFSVKHLFARGPKFVAYYGHLKSQYFPFISLLVLTMILLPIGFIYSDILIYFSFVCLFIWIGGAVYLSHSLSDLRVVLLGGPLIFLVFGSGVMKGLLLKGLGRLK